MIKTNIVLRFIEKSSDGEVVFLVFEPEKKFNFHEGQFVMLESIDYKYEWKTIKRAYSIATTQKRLNEKNEIWFIVKKASELWLSYYLTKKIKIWDSLELTGPAGHLIDEKKYKKYLFISIGSWVAALHPQYIKLTQETKDFDKIVNIFGERYHKAILPHIEKLFSEQNNKIRNFLYLSKEEVLPDNYYHGHVQDNLEEALDFLWDTNFVAILCGKPVMVESVEKILLWKWLKKEQIKFEKY